MMNLRCKNMKDNKISLMMKYQNKTYKNYSNIYKKNIYFIIYNIYVIYLNILFNCLK